MYDLISREAAIEAVGDVHPLDYNGQAILDRIKALPTIDPKMKRDLTQLNRVEQYLKDKGIPYERIDDEGEPISPQFPYYILALERHQIYVPNGKNSEWDVICQKGSYGEEDGLLEIYGCIVAPNAGDSVEGWLTADDVIARIERRENEDSADDLDGE